MRTGVRVGVDAGATRVGVAVSDPDGILATPRATLTRGADTNPDDPRSDDADLVELAATVAEVAAREVVVGLPKGLTGLDGPAADRARKYAQAVAALVAPVPVRLLDERFTTVDAHRALRESGVPGRRHRAVVDQMAAVLILQSALDAERGSGHPPGEPVTVGRRKPRSKDRRR